MKKLKSIEFTVEGTISDARGVAESILGDRLYIYIPDWRERDKYIEKALQSAIYDGQLTKLYYVFLKKIEEPKKPESDQEA